MNIPAASVCFIGSPFDRAGLDRHKEESAAAGPQRFAA